MNISFVTEFDSNDVRCWSGIPYHMQRGFVAAGHDVNLIGPLDAPLVPALRLKKIATRMLTGKRFLTDVSPSILQSYAKQVAIRLKSRRTDVVFSPGSRNVAYLDAKEPIAYWTDATFAGMVDFYPSFSNLTAESIKHGNAAEQAALDRCHVAVYASDWAAQTALRNYRIDPRKVKVVPFGANMACCRTVEDIRCLTAAKPPDICRLLFVGVDWERKGADVAVAVAARLRVEGIKTELTIVGCLPPAGTCVPEFVRLAGFISKTTETGRKEMERLFEESHFLILPSKAECFGIVFCEASSFGVPCVATNVGGIPTAIRDEVNGKTFAIDAATSCYCEWIRSIFENPKRYNELAQSSFAEYESRLNWDVAARTVTNLFKDIVS